MATEAPRAGHAGRSPRKPEQSAEAAFAHDGTPGNAGVDAVREGASVDGWRIGPRLHQGGMATLWEVRRIEPAGDGLDTLPMVMKVPRIRGGEDPATIVGFEVEQMILPGLEGPHVPRFVARGDFTRLPYIVMERIPGASLRERLDAAPLPLDEVIELGARVASALHELHRQGLVHLDVKPSNILQRRDGTIVLIDFGLSHRDQLPDLLDEQFQLPIGTTSATGAITTTEAGAATLVLQNTIPGVTLFTQTHSLDTGRVGELPLCNSNGRTFTVPTSNLTKVVDVSRIYNNTSTATPIEGAYIATFTVGFGLVTEFTYL